MEWFFSLEDINETARLFWEMYADRKVIAFHGEMGAGKTTFIHALCDARNVTDPVSSPTFSIINEYQYDLGKKKRSIFHIDLYRLKDAEDARTAGVEDVLYSGEIVFAEWPERAASIFPPDTLHVYIEPINSVQRRLKISDI